MMNTGITFQQELDHVLFEEEEKFKNDNLIELLCIGFGIR
jgi:hypothetical protein